MEPLSHLCPVFSSTSSLWADSFPIKMVNSVVFLFFVVVVVVVVVLTISFIRENSSLNANSSAASDLCLHSLPIHGTLDMG